MAFDFYGLIPRSYMWSVYIVITGADISSQIHVDLGKI